MFACFVFEPWISSLTKMVVATCDQTLFDGLSAGIASDCIDTLIQPKGTSKGKKLDTMTPVGDQASDLCERQNKRPHTMQGRNRHCCFIPI